MISFEDGFIITGLFIIAGISFFLIKDSYERKERLRHGVQNVLPFPKPQFMYRNVHSPILQTPTQTMQTHAISQDANWKVNFCEYCGFKFIDVKNFCPKCGNKIKY